MRFHFPVIIIDEDFRSENASGLGIRALAEPSRKEGLEVLGVTSYGDLTSSPSSRAGRRPSSCRSTTRSWRWNRKRRWKSCAFVGEIRHKNAEIPIFLHGETRTSATSRTTSCASCMASSTCTRTRRSSSPATSSARPTPTSTACRRPFFRALTHYAADGSYSWHCPATPAASPS